MMDKKKHSLWLVPKDEEALPIQKLVNDLSDQNGVPSFLPHITLVAEITANTEEIEGIKKALNKLASSVPVFSVRLTDYGYTNEIYRCLYLLAQSSELDDLYTEAIEYFPQIKKEHFKSLPHLSVMYGDYDEKTKQKIIKAHPLGLLSFKVKSIDLCLTEGPASDWHIVYSANLLQGR